MREMGLQGVIRTTVSDKVAPCPLDKVNRQFRAPAPNRLWASDFTAGLRRFRAAHAVVCRRQGQKPANLVRIATALAKSRSARLS